MEHILKIIQLTYYKKNRRDSREDMNHYWLSVFGLCWSSRGRWLGRWRRARWRSRRHIDWDWIVRVGCWWLDLWLWLPDSSSAELVTGYQIGGGGVAALMDDGREVVRSDDVSGDEALHGLLLIEGHIRNSQLYQHFVILLPFIFSYETYVIKAQSYHHFCYQIYENNNYKPIWIVIEMKNTETL